MLNKDAIFPMWFNGKIIFRWDSSKTTMHVGKEIIHPISKLRYKVKSFISHGHAITLEHVGIAEIHETPEVCIRCNQLMDMTTYNELAYETRHMSVGSNMVICADCIYMEIANK